MAGMTLGVIVGNRDFFPDVLVGEARRDLLKLFGEVDIAGVVAMYALQLASGRPSALVDWNNNYGGDRNKCVFFHCGNWAKSFLPDIRIGTAPILGTTLGEENTYDAVAGRTPAPARSPSPVSVPTM
jgi:L-fucose isomerase-like protein